MTHDELVDAINAHMNRGEAEIVAAYERLGKRVDVVPYDIRRHIPKDAELTGWEVVDAGVAIQYRTPIRSWWHRVKGWFSP